MSIGRSAMSAISVPLAPPAPAPAAAAVQTEGVRLRRMPYPYRAMLAICSDLDETPDRDVYREIMRFLNTTERTAMGAGVGLEVGNTIYFDMPPDQFAYWNTDDAGRAMVRDLIRSGHIDCLHSYGERATTRAHAQRALDELARHDCTLEVWLDHGTAPTNFGADIMRGSGDVAGSPAYHADLTCAFGVKYVWRGRVTSVVGQDVARRLHGIFTPTHPLASARTLAKEFAKGALVRWAKKDYALHAANALLQPATLRSGQPVWEFMRCNPHWGGVSCGATGAGLPQVLRADVLERLAQREGFMIVYTHLGKVRDAAEPLATPARAALHRLAAYESAGLILVTTTRRLLGYARALRSLVWSVRARGDGSLSIDVLSAAAPADLAGLTFYVPHGRTARLRVNGRDAGAVTRPGPDHTGRCCVSLPWRRLEFPPLAR
jgi:hypothetical protein